jgi:hypothetical protein
MPSHGSISARQFLYQVKRQLKRILGYSPRARVSAATMIRRLAERGRISRKSRDHILQILSGASMAVPNSRQGKLFTENGVALLKVLDATDGVC